VKVGENRIKNEGKRKMIHMRGYGIERTSMEVSV